MRKILLAAILIACSGSARAATPSIKDQTVADFLGACAKSGDPVSQSNCDTPIHINILTIGMMQGLKEKGAVNVCLPADGDFEKLKTAIIGWLGQHAEMQKLKADDGVQNAIEALYPCR